MEAWVHVCAKTRGGGKCKEQFCCCWAAIVGQNEKSALCIETRVCEQNEAQRKNRACCGSECLLVFMCPACSASPCCVLYACVLCRCQVLCFAFSLSLYRSSSRWNVSKQSAAGENKARDTLRMVNIKQIIKYSEKTTENSVMRQQGLKRFSFIHLD